MTQWVADPRGGRERGPRAVARAWVEVLIRPRRFFRVGVAPGDQAPGLLFAVGVVSLASLLRLALSGETVVGTPYPTFGDQRLLSVVLVFSVITTLVAPLVLHLVAALQTLLLLPFAPDRGGVSETVQVIGYATAPCALVGVPIPAVQALAAGYGAVLFAVGVSVVHSVALPRAAALCALPAAAVFGIGFGGFEAMGTVFSAGT